jgi:two-component system, response regulator PdtaR
MSKETAVLLVEDEPLLGELMIDALSDRGFTVHVAPSASGALDHLMSGAHVDVLFTDIDLGDGMDGATLARLVREMRPRLPILYASGRWGSIDQFPAVPGAAFVPKPYSVDEIGATLERLAQGR